ncbi:MAG: hypothetical protein WGN25_00270 [Candidatus Electrothrix sp. GW3-4]|uniref:hypothetical protein n=1 Tax=Candidatus Electrothrix sp. GW3-4 TaxID=3126740 RepID=UPI0030D091CB
MEKESVRRQQEDDDNNNLVARHIRFQPVYAELIDRACADLKLTQRELLEECLKRSLGDPSGIFDD